MYLDQHLTWKNHIDFIAKKGKSNWNNQQITFLPFNKNFIIINYTLVYPYISYCNIVWSSTYPSNLNRIFLLQKRVVRIISKTTYLAHTAPLFRKLNILDIFSVHSLAIGNFMFSYHQRLLPPSFSDIFITSSQVHSYNTRSAPHYRSHPCRTNIKQLTILHQGPSLWNSLPSSIKLSLTITSFKKSLKKFLIDKQHSQ